mgnify:FL=1|jgi:hypothetical protein|tara:strand:+ start:807 stop:1178 length:372 start_codon:yes stop_codon:yes gene_type:complete
MTLLEFADKEFINLITFRKDNTPVQTPVWLSSLEDCLVVTTNLNAGKVKRIRNNGLATIYVTNQSGSEKLSEEVDVKASIIDNEKEKQLGIKSIQKKYGAMAKVFMRGSDEVRAIIKLEEKEE